MGIFLGILLVPFAYLLSSGALNFGPKTPKTSSLLKPITRSQGYVASFPSQTVSRTSGYSEPKVSSLTANVGNDKMANESMDEGGLESVSLNFSWPA
jgi:hypothetical protein